MKEQDTFPALMEFTAQLETIYKYLKNNIWQFERG